MIIVIATTLENGIIQFLKADNMEKYIQEKLDKNTKKNINFYRVCSVNKKTRKGEIKPYGRELIVNRIFETFLKDVCQKVSKKYAEDSYNIYYKILYLFWEIIYLYSLYQR